MKNILTKSFLARALFWLTLGAAMAVNLAGGGIRLRKIQPGTFGQDTYSRYLMRMDCLRASGKLAGVEFVNYFSLNDRPDLTEDYFSAQHNLVPLFVNPMNADDRVNSPLLERLHSGDAPVIFDRPATDAAPEADGVPEPEAGAGEGSGNLIVACDRVRLRAPAGNGAGKTIIPEREASH